MGMVKYCNIVILLIVVTFTTFSSANVPRDRIMNTADSYATLNWYCSEANRTVECTNNWSSNFTVGYHTGVCYDWGGYVRTSTFLSDLENGEGAGSHSWHGILSCTTGVDCSGYVSQCWESGHHTTRSLPNISYEISSSEMKPGDIWNKSGSHVVLHSGTNSDGRPTFYEASGSASKVRHNTTASSSFLNGYISRRYNFVEDGPDTRTCDQDGIIIDSFPFSHSGNTGESSCENYTYYSCAPEILEGGPEIYYKLMLNQNGTLSVSVSDSAGIDIDIHVLSQLDSSSCLARDDIDLNMQLQTGTYYIVVDTWQSIGMAGPYTLLVDFEPNQSNSDPVQPETGKLKGVVFENDGSGTNNMNIRLSGAIVNLNTGQSIIAQGVEASWDFTLPEGEYTATASMLGYTNSVRNCVVMPQSETYCSIGLTKSENNCDLDSDNDGICDSEDNCPFLYNIGQLDEDMDGAGDLCDLCKGKPNIDSDNDKICDSLDNCPFIENLNQIDTDNDKVGDKCDLCIGWPNNDTDEDSICNSKDNCPEIKNTDQLDTNADGVGDDCEDKDTVPENINNNENIEDITLKHKSDDGGCSCTSID